MPPLSAIRYTAGRGIRVGKGAGVVTGSIPPPVSSGVGGCSCANSGMSEKAKLNNMRIATMGNRFDGTEDIQFLNERTGNPTILSQIARVGIHISTQSLITRTNKELKLKSFEVHLSLIFQCVNLARKAD